MNAAELMWALEVHPKEFHVVMDGYEDGFDERTPRCPLTCDTP